MKAMPWGRYRKFGATRLAVTVLAVAVWLVTTDVVRADASGSLQVGGATIIINAHIGDWVQGAGKAHRATAIHDDLEANALYLSNDETRLLWISCDLAALDSSFIGPVRETIGKATGIPPRNVLISCTHTHGGPSVRKTNYHYSAR